MTSVHHTGHRQHDLPEALLVNNAPTIGGLRSKMPCTDEEYSVTLLQTPDSHKRPWQIKKLHPRGSVYSQGKFQITKEDTVRNLGLI